MIVCHSTTFLVPVAFVADGMRAYFLPPRFYSTEFPYAGLKLKMVSNITMTKFSGGVSGTVT